MVKTSLLIFTSTKSVVEEPSTQIHLREGDALPDSQAGTLADSN
jgi:hypothetical protein